jgi:hypothetical protein
MNKTANQVLMNAIEDSDTSPKRRNIFRLSLYIALAITVSLTVMNIAQLRHEHKINKAGENTRPLIMPPMPH